MRRHLLVVGLLVAISTCSKKIDALAAQDLSLHYDVYCWRCQSCRRRRLRVETRIARPWLRTAGILGVFAR
jgi:hypothetical protein